MFPRIRNENKARRKFRNDDIPDFLKYGITPELVWEIGISIKNMKHGRVCIIDPFDIELRGEDL